MKGKCCHSIKSVEFSGWTTTAPDGAFFVLDNADNSLYIPLIELGNTNSIVTSSDRYLVYQFDGKHFVFKRKSAGSWLHKDLRSFESLLYAGQSKGYLIRIDQTADGYRYAAWKSNKCMADKPDLILTSWSTLGHGTLIDLGYSFENQGYTYEIWTEDYPEGPQLKVYKGENLILQQALDSSETYTYY